MPINYKTLKYKYLNENKPIQHHLHLFTFEHKLHVLNRLVFEVKKNSLPQNAADYFKHYSRRTSVL